MSVRVSRGEVGIRVTSDGDARKAVEAIQDVMDSTDRLKSKAKEVGEVGEESASGWLAQLQEMPGRITDLASSFDLIGDAFGAIDGLQELAHDVAVNRQQAAALARAYGDVDAALDRLRQETFGTLNSNDLSEAANKGQTLGLTIDEVATSINAANRIAIETGEDFRTTFDQIVESAFGMSDTFTELTGTVFDFKEAQKRVSEDTNVFGQNISEAEVQARVMSEALEELRKANEAIPMDEQAQDIMRLEAEWEDLKDTIFGLAVGPLVAVHQRYKEVTHQNQLAEKAARGLGPAFDEVSAAAHHMNEAIRLSNGGYISLRDTMDSLMSGGKGPLVQYLELVRELATAQQAQRRETNEATAAVVKQAVAMAEVATANLEIGADKVLSAIADKASSVSATLEKVFVEPVDKGLKKRRTPGRKDDSAEREAREEEQRIRRFNERMAQLTEAANDELFVLGVQAYDERTQLEMQRARDIEKINQELFDGLITMDVAFLQERVVNAQYYADILDVQQFEAEERARREMELLQQQSDHWRFYGDTIRNTASIASQTSPQFGAAIAASADLTNIFADNIGDLGAAMPALGQGLGKLTASLVKDTKTQAAILGAFELASGFAQLFINPKRAAAHFVASGLYFAVAGTSKGKGSSGGQRASGGASASGFGGGTNQPANTDFRPLTFYISGPIFAGDTPSAGAAIGDQVRRAQEAGFGGRL